MNTPLIISQTLPCANGKTIGLITLNNPASLNAQNTEMVSAISQILRAWDVDTDVAVIVMRGMGEKAFCAGGDIRSMYHAMIADSAFPNPQAQAFFAAEYALCHQIHTYRKPIIVWGSGIVMGGGLGLAAAASHCVVTETTQMAMPEIAIGLFPDAGASWFLQRMPEKLGLFFGLTGARFNANDALWCNLAHSMMNAADFDVLMTALYAACWDESVEINQSVATACLRDLHQADRLPESRIQAHRALLHRITHAADLCEADAVLREHQTDDAWLAQALSQYRNGSPLTAALVWAMFARVRHLSLADALRLELNVAMRCCAGGEFAEGVRALLIDKDKQPHWLYAQVSDVPDDFVSQHFVSPFAAGQHPFAHLGGG